MSSSASSGKDRFLKCALRPLPGTAPLGCSWPGLQSSPNPPELVGNSRASEPSPWGLLRYHSAFKCQALYLLPTRGRTPGRQAAFLKTVFLADESDLTETVNGKQIQFTNIAELCRVTTKRPGDCSHLPPCLLDKGGKITTNTTLTCAKHVLTHSLLPGLLLERFLSALFPAAFSLTVLCWPVVK